MAIVGADTQVLVLALRVVAGMAYAGGRWLDAKAAQAPSSLIADVISAAWCVHDLR